MTTKTRKAPSADTPPPTFGDIARKKMQARIEAYRQHARRAADGEQLTEEALSDVADLLAVMSLPDYAWTLHVEALKRHDAVAAKLRAVVDAEPANRERSQELRREIEAVQAKLKTLMEERRLAEVAVNKPGTYGHSLAQLEAEHPVVLGDIDTAVTLRLTEQEKRRASS
jgi:hypothetical protein